MEDSGAKGARESKGSIEALSNQLKPLTEDMRLDAFLSLVYTADVANRYISIKFKKYKSHRTRYGILVALITHGGTMTPTEIGKSVFRSSDTITRIVDRLERDGLVKREPQDTDRRVRKVTITRKGIDFIKSTMATRQKLSHEATSCLDREQIEELRSTLTQLRKHMRKFIGEKLTRGSR